MDMETTPSLTGHCRLHQRFSFLGLPNDLTPKNICRYGVQIIWLSDMFGCGSVRHHVCASGGKTARVVVQIFLIVVCFSGVSGGGVGGDVNVHWTCTLTWCYATARSLQFTQRRDATLLHVLFNLHNDVMLRYCTFSSIYTLTRCYATARSLQFTQLRDATLTGVGGWGGVITSMLTPSWSLRL